MKKKIFIGNFDLEIGGVERSLIGLLSSFDYEKYDVDLFLYNHKGELFKQVPKKTNILPEISEYTTFRKSIIQVLSEGHLFLASTRILCKFFFDCNEKKANTDTFNNYYLRTFYHSMPFLPKIKGEYDIALSFLTPHYVVTEKVNAKVKVAFIHTDYTAMNVDKGFETKMWDKYDYIAAVSKECKEAFVRTFPNLKNKCLVIENILSPKFIIDEANVDITKEIPRDDSIKLCSVGRMTYAKGFDEAVYACKKLVSLGYKIKWYIIGYGKDELFIKKIIDENNLKDIFILLGKKTNPYPYIKACDIYVQPSRYEGKAVTVREAQILGKAVVITNFSTSKSQVEDGVDGYICPMGVNGIVEGARKLIDDVEFRNKIAFNASTRDYSNEKEVEKVYKLT